MPRTPVYLNNRNWVTSLQAMIIDVRRMGGEPIVVDNDSTYPPLLDFYRHTDAQVVRLGMNAGHYAPWLEGVVDDARPYIVSDCDLDLSQCPDDTIEHMLRLAPRYPQQKIGLSLKLEPWRGIPLPERFRPQEASYWKTDLGPVYLAGVDTTFALYRPGDHFAHFNGVRTKPPYAAAHIGWYLDNSTNEEVLYYKAHASSSVHTSGKAGGNHGNTWIPALDQVAVQRALATGMSIHALDTGLSVYDRKEKPRRVVSFTAKPLTPAVKAMLAAHGTSDQVPALPRPAPVAAPPEGPGTVTLPSEVTVWCLLNFNGMNPILTEVADHVMSALEELGIHAVLSTNPGPGINLLLGGHGAPAGMALPPNTILLNLEQDADRWVNDKGIYQRAACIFNYEAEAHRRFLERGLRSVPCYYGSTRLMESLEPVEEKYDVVFFGRLTPYRESILTKLQKRELTVFSNGRQMLFGRAKQEAMLASRVYLNLHSFEDSNFMSVRTLPAMAAGRCVVTDPFVGSDLYDFEGGLVIASADDIVDRIETLVCTGAYKEVGARGKAWAMKHRYAHQLRAALETFLQMDPPATQEAAIIDLRALSCPQEPVRVTGIPHEQVAGWIRSQWDRHQLQYLVDVRDGESFLVRGAWKQQPAPAKPKPKAKGKPSVPALPPRRPPPFAPHVSLRRRP